MPEQFVSLQDIAGGALHELFDREMERVASDILDLNTEAEAVRTVNIKVSIKPDKDRNFGPCAITVWSGLGKPKPIGTTLFFGRKFGKPVVVENVPEQSELFDKYGPRPEMPEINSKTGGTE